MIQNNVPRKAISNLLKISQVTVTKQHIKLMQFVQRYNNTHPIFFLANEEIEIDEMIEDWNDGTEHGSAFFTMCSRQTGKVHIEAVRDKAGGSLLPIIDQHIQIGATIISDAWTAYKVLSQRGYQHKVINKKQDGFCRTEEKTNIKIHVNRVENLHAYIRRTIEHHSKLIMTHGKLIVAECLFRKNFKDLFLSIVV
jgi:transposase-like protein